MCKSSLFLIPFLIFICSFVPVLAIEPEQMEYPVSSGRQYMISDPDGYLSLNVKEQLEKELEELRTRYSVEVALVLPPDIGDMEPAQWCERLFTKWGIGKADKDNGLLIMISPGSKSAFIMPGYGLEGIFTDIVCSRLLREYVVPAMRENDVNMAASNLVAAISKIMSDPVYADEMRSAQSERYAGDVQTLDSSVFWTFVQYVIAFIFFVTLCLFGFYCFKSRLLSSNYQKAEFWRSRLLFLIVLGVCSFGTGLVFAGLAYILYRFWRTKRLSCSTCGHKMKRLAEDKDNELLNDSQDFEENIKTVDYDVWECPDCGTIERFPYKSHQKKYSECPSCHTIAMSLESDSIVKQPTIKTAGIGVKTYRCKYCGHENRTSYAIPKKEDPAAALAAGAVLGAMGSSHRGGGNGFGGGGFGGFGGGSTGGGGAGARW